MKKPYLTFGPVQCNRVYPTNMCNMMHGGTIVLPNTEMVVVLNGRVCQASFPMV